MSLERGVILWRLNQELFPDPGNPMARITLPFGTRGATVGEAFAAAGITGASASLSGADSDGAPLDGAVPAGRDPPLPRPPRPRRRRRRGSPGSAFALRLRRASRRHFRRFFRRVLRFTCCGHFGFRLARFRRGGRARLGIKVSWLQRRGCRFTLARLWFFALETIAHPFAHVWLLTQPHTRGQWTWMQENQDRQATTPIRKQRGKGQSPNQAPTACNEST